VGALSCKRHPDLFTQEFLKVERAGRILIDTGRNGFGATVAVAYGVRARPGAPVSAPCLWTEIERGQLGPQSVTLRTLRERLERIGEPWAALHAQPCSLDAPLARLESELTPEDWQASHAAAVRRPGKRRDKPRRR
jgi:bifunctional non-homologous end joining protein LigD